MGRVMLISFAGYPYTPSSLMPDNGLASLAGCLKAEDHTVRIADYGTIDTAAKLFPGRLRKLVSPVARAMFLENRELSWLERLRFIWAGTELEKHQARARRSIAHSIAERVAEFKPDVTGLKLWNGDGFSGSLRIASSIRKTMPNTFIVAGGPHVDYFGRHILNYTDVFDALLAGEGETALPRLVQKVSEGKNWQDIGGLIYRHNGQIKRNPCSPPQQLDECALPTYNPDVYPALRGDQKIKIGIVDESRGCPNRCAFCIHPIKSGGKWRLKSPARIVREMRRIMNQLNTRYFIYSGSNTPAKTAVATAERILREGLDVRYGCFGHFKGIGPADFELLYKSGCRAIFYGLESASPRILRDAFNKPIDVKKAEEVIRQTKEAGIKAITSIIYPAPGEDKKSRRQTLEFLRKVKPDSVPITIPGMIPGTSWEQNPEKYGFRKENVSDFWRRALTYKIKLLYPPTMWDPLPYTLNGKSSKELFEECQSFGDEIKQAGITTNVPHEMALMAEALPGKTDLTAFRDRARSAFFSGDIGAISRLTQRINDTALTTGSSSLQEYKPRPISSKPV